MTFSVLSFGNAAMLETVLNGVAMLADSTGEYNVYGLAKLGLMVSLIGIGISSVMTQKLEPQKLLIGMVFFYVMFAPKETVTVEDVYTGDTFVVANVPIGVAYPMYAITNIGKWLTDAFETVYSLPEAGFKNGYMNALHVLINANKVATGPAHIAVERSVSNYINQCVNYAIFDDYLDSASRPSIESLNTSLATIDGLKTEYVNRDVLTYITSAGLGSNLVQMSCVNAYDAMSSYLSVDFATEWSAELSKSVLKYGKNSRNPSDEVQKAATALGLEITGGYTYMTNALLNNMVKCQSFGECAMMTQKIEQRNVEWGGDKQLFLEVARPIMAFVEVLVCAITPLMAFLVSIGPQGVSMGAKYFLMLIWVCLWQPLLAICNMYIHIAATQDLGVFKITGVNFESNLGMGNTWETLQSWIATGNMMASAVPGLALMLVYGGSVAATSLASRMNGGHVDAKAVRPDLISGGAMVSHGGMRTIGADMVQSAQGGLSVGGAGNPFSLKGDSSQAASLVSSRQNSLDQATTATAQADQRAGAAFEKNASKAAEHAMANGSFAGTSSSVRSSTGTGESASRAQKWGHDTSNAFNSVVSAAIDSVAKGQMSPEQASKSVGNAMKDIAKKSSSAGGSVGAGVDLSAKGSDGTSYSDALAKDIRESAEKAKSSGVDSGTRDSSTFTNSVRNGMSASLSGSAGLSYSQARSERQSAQNAFNEAQSLQSSVGSGVQFSAADISGITQKDPGLRSAIASKAAALTTPSQVEGARNALKNAGHLFTQDPSDGGADKTMGQVFAMIQGGHSQELMGLMSQHGYMPSGNLPGGTMGSHMDNQGLTKQAPGLTGADRTNINHAGTNARTAAAAANPAVQAAASGPGSTIKAPAPSPIDTTPPPPTGNGGAGNGGVSAPGGPAGGGAEAGSGGPGSAGSSSPASRAAAPAGARGGARAPSRSPSASSPPSAPSSTSPAASPSAPSPGGSSQPKSSAPPVAGVASGMDPKITRAAERNAAAFDAANPGAGTLDPGATTRLADGKNKPSKEAQEAGAAVQGHADAGVAIGQAAKAVSDTWSHMSDQEKAAVGMALGGAIAANAAAAGVGAAVAGKAAKATRSVAASTASRIGGFLRSSAGQKVVGSAFMKSLGKNAALNAIPSPYTKAAAIALSAAMAAPEVIDAYKAYSSKQDSIEAASSKKTSP